MSPFEKQDRKPDKPPHDEEILRILVEIWQAIGRTNQILRETEKNNERRHRELMAVLNPSARHIKFVFGTPEAK